MTKKKVKTVTGPPKLTITPEEKATIDKALELRKTPPAPRLKVRDGAITVDHPNDLIGNLLLYNALGSMDGGFISGFRQQLARMSSRGSKISETDLNFMVSVIKGIEPRDQVEAMLASQMAAIQMTMLGFASQISEAEALQQQDSATRAMIQLAKVFALQMDTLKRYRSSGDQNITVQHVSVSDGGQAIVGNVTQNPGKATSDKTPPAPPALTHSQTLPMEPTATPSRQPVSVKRKTGR